MQVGSSASAHPSTGSPAPGVGMKGGPPQTAHPSALEAEQKYLAAVRKQLADVANGLAEKLAKLEPGNPAAAQLRIRLETLQRFGETLGVPQEGVSAKAH